MPRIRSLKPEHKHHRKIGPLSDRDYRLWVGMLTEADDQGRLVADGPQLRMLVFGYHQSVTLEHVEAAILRLHTVGLIELYEISDIRYAVFPSWRDHQVVNKPSPSKLPPPLNSGNGTGTLPEQYEITTVGSRSDLIGSRSDLEQGPHRQQAASAIPRVAPTILAALDRSARLGAVPRLRSPAFWYAEAGAAQGTVDLGAEILKAEAWLSANPAKAPRKDLPRFLHNWLRRAKDEL